MTTLGPEFGYLEVHPEPEARRSDREVILLLHGLGGSIADWNSPQHRGLNFDHENDPADRHDDGNWTPPLIPPGIPTDVSFSDSKKVRCWSGILRGLGHTVIYYSQDGKNDIAEIPLQQLEELIIPYIRETVLQGPLADKKVTVIAHSRGGVLIRYYLARNPEAASEWIGQVITLHSPHSGTNAPNAYRRIADWVDSLASGGDLPAYLAGQLAIDLLDGLTSWLDMSVGDRQLLPGNPLFDRLSQPADTPTIEFHTFGGSSVTLTRLYAWLYTPDSYIPDLFNLAEGDGPFDWTMVPIEIPILSPMFDALPDEAVYAEEITGRGDIAVTVESSQISNVQHHTLPINHDEALYDEELFGAVAGLLGTPLGSTEAIGCIERTTPLPEPIYVTTFGAQSWLITPAARAINEPPPENIGRQKWLLVLSGVGIVNMRGTSNWAVNTVHILPDMRVPLDYAINQFSIPRPAGREDSDYGFSFEVEQWAPFAGLSSIFDQNQSVNAGFSVNAWRHSSFSTGTDAFSGQTVNNIFNGIDVDVAVRDSDAWLLRLGYNITLLGRIVFTKVDRVS
jgi:pimeloyl-ACP methyl ester carboxylesterase